MTVTADAASLETAIERLYTAGADADRDEARTVFATLRAELSSGRIRAAVPDLTAATGWRVNAWVKQGILVGFRCGEIAAFAGPDPAVPFLDKDTLPLKPLDQSSHIRLVPGGSSIRDGAFVGAGVICMPPMFINIGAYVGEGSLIDSHALVGSCAQVGQRVHVSAAAQIGGVLEPLQAGPVVIEDGAFIGARAEVAEGVRVYVNDTHIGKTPLKKMKMLSDRYLVRFERDGFDDWSRYIDLGRNQSYTLHPILERSSPDGGTR